MYYEYYFLGIILLPAIIFSMYAQFKVTADYEKYSKIFSASGITAGALVRRILDNSGLYDIKITQVKGHLNNYYNHSKKVIALNQDIINSSSISALGIACHEAGHALQYQSHYAPIKIRNFVIPLCNFANVALWPLIIIGLIFNFSANTYSLMGQICLYSGLIFFGLSVILNLITLPVEYNASYRARVLLVETGALSLEEVEGAKRILNSAALTYVAALIVSIFNLIRFLLVFTNRD